MQGAESRRIEETTRNILRGPSEREWLVVGESPRGSQKRENTKKIGGSAGLKSMVRAGSKLRGGGSLKKGGKRGGVKGKN